MKRLLERGVSTAIRVGPRAREVRVTDEAIIAYLIDAGSISVPLAGSWRLSDATPEAADSQRVFGWTL